MNLREQFEQEMNGKLQPLLKELDAPFIKQKYVSEYVQWLETKLAQKPEVSEGEPDFNAQAIAAFNRMLANEQCGGTGWWSGWEALKTALWKLQP